MKKISEKEILKTPVFKVVEKEFENIKFKPVGLNCNDWVMVVITDGENAIFVKQTRWGLEEKTVEFPCGTVDPEEVEELGREEARGKAAIREVKEETGIEVDKVDVLVTFNPNPAYFNNTMTIFKVDVPNLRELWDKRGEQKLDENEDCAPFIAPIHIVKNELMKHAMGIAALYAIKGAE